MLFEQSWHALIVEHQLSEEAFYFIDEGEKLPFFLKSWRHHHELKNLNGQTIITDYIKFSTGTYLSDILIFPLLWIQFMYRKPIYRKHFDARNG